MKRITPSVYEELTAPSLSHQDNIQRQKECLSD